MNIFKFFEVKPNNVLVDILLSRLSNCKDEFILPITEKIDTLIEKYKDTEARI